MGLSGSECLLPDFGGGWEGSGGSMSKAQNCSRLCPAPLLPASFPEPPGAFPNFPRGCGGVPPPLLKGPRGQRQALSLAGEVTGCV